MARGVIIDPDTGAITLPDGSVLAASTSEDVFLDTAIGRESEAILAGSSMRSYRLPTVEDRDDRLDLLIGFEKGVLDLVACHVCHDDDSACQAADERTLDVFKALVQRHERWITGKLGAERGFRWGTVEVFTDEEHRWCSVSLTYRPRMLRMWP